MKKRKYLILHCSDTPNNRVVTGEDIRRWHTDPKPKGNGWKQVGYEIVIRRDGTIERLVEDNGDDVVDSWEVTNGAAGVNSISSHICLIGGRDVNGKPNLEMTLEQHDSLVGVIKDKLIQQPSLKIAGHYHFSNKTCPNFNVEDWCEKMRVNKKNIFNK